MKEKRNIIQIDESLCNGCGKCILDCAEGAIALVDGKARVIADMYCDGLGACLSGCPTNALQIITREADAYDEEAVIDHLARQGRTLQHAGGHSSSSTHGEGGTPASGGCAGSQASRLPLMPGKTVQKSPLEHSSGAGGQVLPSSPTGIVSSLIPLGKRGAGESGCPGAKSEPLTPLGSSHAAKRQVYPSSGETFLNEYWPLKLRLMQPSAPFLQGADILLAADCSGFASGVLQQLKTGKVCLIVCPKFEEKEAVIAKLADIVKTARPKSLTSVRMEVPCCKGTFTYALEAVEKSGVFVAVTEIVVSRQGTLS